MQTDASTILIVDDIEDNRNILAHFLKRQGHESAMATNGLEALEMVRQQSFDLILLDIMMPVMDGYQTLTALKADAKLHHIPVVVISALDDLDSAARCIKLGAEDYLPKPFNRTVLEARVNASLEKKWVHDIKQAFMDQLRQEQQRSEQLLLNVLPKSIADRLKNGEKTIADHFADVTVLFADIVGFTELSARQSPEQLVTMLNNIFTAFDELVDIHALEKIKTIGDAYMVVGGLPEEKPNHVEAMAEMALGMQQAIAQFNQTHDQNLSLRIGIHSGPVVAGIIGHRKFSYDLWGDTVNVAQRMESHGLSGAIQVSETTYQRLQHLYELQPRGCINVKGKGEMSTYLLVGKRAEVMAVV